MADRIQPAARLPLPLEHHVPRKWAIPDSLKLFRCGFLPHSPEIQADQPRLPPGRRSTTRTPWQVWAVGRREVSGDYRLEAAKWELCRQNLQQWEESAFLLLKQRSGDQTAPHAEASTPCDAAGYQIREQLEQAGRG